MDIFFIKNELPKFIQEEIDKPESLRSTKEVKCVAKNIATKKSDELGDEYYKHLNEEIIPSLYKLFQKLKEENTSQLFL